VIRNFVRLAQIAPKRTIVNSEYAILAILTPELVKENSALKGLPVKPTTPAQKMFAQLRTKMKNASMLKNTACLGNVVTSLVPPRTKIFFVTTQIIATRQIMFAHLAMTLTSNALKEKHANLMAFARKMNVKLIRNVMAWNPTVFKENVLTKHVISKPKVPLKMFATKLDTALDI
jgi:hypothetical protein